MKQVLEGVKVADFGWYGVGPWTCRYLANHGAEVVHIESTVRVDGLRTTHPFKDGRPGVNRATFFTLYNCDKYGITLNLKHPLGLKVAKRIVAWADVVVDNHAPGMMRKLGLNYEELKKVKPDIIMLEASSHGQTGPRASLGVLGTHLQGLTGFTSITGWPDRIPTGGFMAYTDPIIPILGAASILAALEYRRRTGQGQYLDVSQLEAGLLFLAPLLLDFSVNNRVASRRGNRCSYAAPHGVYRCQGDDRWCAIAIFSDEAWNRLCTAMGNPDWSRDPKFATFLSRKQHEDELDRLIEEWTIGLKAEDVMTLLQSAGIGAGVVENCQDLSADPQLQHRSQGWEADHPEIGRHQYEAPAFILSKTRAAIRMPAPCLGQHNEYFCTKVLGMSDEEFLGLLGAGVFD